MRTSFAASVGGVALMAGSPGLAAQPPEVEADLRCIAIVAAAVGQAQGEARTGVIGGMMYFIGRVEGRAPAIDLEAELRRIYTALTQEVVETERIRCGGILSEKGQRLQAVGKALQTVQ
ncbi:hypothetical protein [Sphingobium nicotianae]|uniref:Uncharacterized protein n=1 Tax=Sphingobium nicotianae TaxID=2782607 RepID=A0A9X1DES7_9SPHN|nr:hypothetical protein [Sphingobium nicotianae]MBT2188584.1 hypothetical protein [Sphingobium nicotianae]